ncbi:bifunctional tetrahydrofolate synthase/dihydrofolate synthase [Shewanella salipaludis]|uniref:Dihydrofolate synthase/folylpolyglutamate synthase n=1 Tax=Shewanella salipaludis TaxID=2723052 RepID=A0A972G206_9GAMM|nr:bifunctional tetrahydrofolate synthase/dihydrofolate synthase [Shewanella salipaludis]NMH66061.1 bifunctional tetrahydrofolate synthase/dihydrofolate synthase [Shewanella salipaludis]
MPHAPQQDASLDTWLDYLLALHPTEIDMGLARVLKVASLMGLTHLGRAKVVTVAGTNGKGTTCAMVEQILRLSGLRVGVYSSPHMLKYNERIRIEGEDASDGDLIEAFEAIERHRGDTSLTFFEYATLAGLYLFKAADLDAVILEVGLGGRLDATNIIDADISVVTAVDLDHQLFLGDTREAVGREKAGIFRRQRPAVIGEPDLPASVDETAIALGAIPYRVGREFSYQPHGHSWDFNGRVFRLTDIPLPALPLPNAATAIAVIEMGWPELAPAVIHEGIATARLAGRLERVSEQPLIMLDVAHNPHAARYLAKRLYPIKAALEGGGRLFALCGMLKDKDIARVLPELLELVDAWYLVSLSGERGASAQQLHSALPAACEAHEFDDLAAAWEALNTQITADDVVIVFGSFYTVAGFKSLLDGK